MAQEIQRRASRNHRGTILSTGFECEFFQWNEGEWYYILQDWDCPVGAWDWREYSTCYGPFKDQAQADRHLSHNHANPGGSCIDEGADKTDPVMQELVKSARK